jgi:adenosylmethionine---8-amino-7-oxononanoate aminotransferase
MTSTRALARWDRRHVWHPFTQQAEWEKQEPLIVRSARGAWLTDTRGRRYLDGVSSLWVTVHGHREPALDRAVRRQLTRMAHTTFLGLTHEPAIRLARELVRSAPRGLTRVFYSDSGSTAVEIALKMAYQYHVQKTGSEERTEFLALENSYHGDTLGSVSVGGIRLFHEKFRPLLFRANFAMSPYCYRCPYRRNGYAGRFRITDEPPVSTPKPGDFRAETGCRWECLGKAERIIRARRKRLAACVVEPVVQGAAGMIVAPPGYLKGLERLCRRYGVLLIADEVATGFGRTGPMFAVDREGVRPDFLCAAKSLTGGYLPLAATLASERVYEAFLGRYEDFKTFFHGHTYTANPLACAAALANLRLYGDRRLLDRLRPKIDRLSRWLKTLSAFPFVGDVRQAGFMAGVELVADKSTRRPFPVQKRAAHRVCLAARHHGVWIRPLGDTLVILPPLGISDVDLTRLFNGIGRAMKETLAKEDSPKQNKERP